MFKRQRKPLRRSLRLRILEADNYKCRYCGIRPRREDLEVHHILPVSKGGSNTRRNLVATCSSCNRLIGNLRIPPPPRGFLGILARVVWRSKKANRV